MIKIFYTTLINIKTQAISREKPEYFVLYSEQQPEDRRYFVAAGKSPELKRTGVSMNMILPPEERSVSEVAVEEAQNKLLR